MILELSCDEKSAHKKQNHMLLFYLLETRVVEIIFKCRGYFKDIDFFQYMFH